MSLSALGPILFGTFFHLYTQKKNGGNSSHPFLPHGKYFSHVSLKLAHHEEEIPGLLQIRFCIAGGNSSQGLVIK